MPSRSARAPDELRQALTERLTDGLHRLRPGPAMAITTPIIDQLCAYIILLCKWNRRFNLTAVRDPLAMVPKHILDSLAVLPFINGRRCLDVGAGAGLPGMILAIASPQQRWTLLDSNGKKARFMRQAVIELQLGNVEVIQQRVEDYIPVQAFSTIISRAYSALGAYLISIKRLRGVQQRILAMKGALPTAELQALEAMGLRHKIKRLTVPGIDAERNLVIIEGNDQYHYQHKC